MKELDFFLAESSSFYDDKKYKQGLEFALKALEIDSTSLVGHLLSALNYFELKKMKEALHHFELAKHEAKSSPQAMSSYAVTLSENQRGQDALNMFKEITELYPDYTPVSYNYGRCLMLNKKHAEAIPWLDKAETESNMPYGVLHDRGTCWYFLNEYDKAEKDLQKLIDIKPDYTHASLLLAHISMKKGLWDKAIEHTSRLLYFKPEHADALKLRFQSRLQQKDKNGNIFNRKGAQEDADRMMALNISLFMLKTPTIKNKKLLN